MKGKLVYIELATTAIFVCFLFRVNLYVYASDVPHIAFSSNRSGNYDIYVMDINGKNLQQLTDHPAYEYDPAFSPDGQWMAYVSSRHDGYSEIYVMNLRTKVSHRLTNHPKHDSNPAWSPDGRWIAFESNRAGMHDIYKIEPDGENLQRLTHEGSNHLPAWSPDSQSIAFVFHPAPGEGGRSGIYIMDADGGNPRHLANQPQAGNTPTWSPDGKQIAFSDKILRQNREIYILNVDGNGLRRMTRSVTADWSPDWSPDGRSIVFFSKWNEKSDIYLIKTVGSRLTVRLTRHPANDKDPTWVPAGFLSIYPTAETQTTLWGRLKQSVGD